MYCSSNALLIFVQPVLLRSSHTQRLSQGRLLHSHMATAELALGTIGFCESLYQFWESFPFNVIFVGHALYCTVAGSDFKNRWLLHLLVSEAQYFQPSTPSAK